MTQSSGEIESKQYQPESIRLAVFASGEGSNLKSIVDHIEAGTLENVAVRLVISNNSKSGAIEFARSVGIEAVYCSLTLCGGDELDFQNRLLDLLEQHKINLIVLAGYLKKLPDGVVEQFASRILNVHPALLPSFGGREMYGLRVHQAVLSRGCKVSGATVHLVTHQYDEGPIVLQECCNVHDEDSAETLAARVLAIEHRLLPKAIQLFASGRS